MPFSQHTQIFDTILRRKKGRKKDGKSYEAIKKAIFSPCTSTLNVTGTPLRKKKNYPHTATTPEEDAAIINYSNNNPFDPATKIKQRLDLRASLTIIKSRLRANGLFARRPAKKTQIDGPA